MQVIPELGIGGAEIMCENIANALTLLGHEVLVVSLYNTHTTITNRLEYNGVQVEYVGKKKGIDLSMPLKLRRIITKFHPDVIHTHLYALKYVFLSQIQSRVKIVHTIHHLADKESKVERLLNRILFKHFNVTPIALSEQIQVSITKEYHLSPAQVPIVPNGVPIENCTRKTCYDFDHWINLVHLGRLHPAKNHQEMITAAVKLHMEYPQIKLHLYGEGELKEQIIELIALNEAQNYVILHGATTNPLKELAKADIFILPSNYEGIPMTVIEAMGTGLPIIASNVGGIPDMISNNFNGLLCEPTAESIYENIKKLITDKNLRATIGNNAADSASNFSSQTMARKYFEIYN